jgi:hypothetical protein
MNRTRIVFLSGFLSAVFSACPAADLIHRQGRYIDLTTDLASADQAQRLVESFDAAVPQWTEFWKLPADSVDRWKVKAFVIGDKARFRREGLIPNHIPDFPFGYAWGDSVWVLAQQNDYYTRHLLLHEGVHALAFSQFGGAGPTWFMEGTAELLAVHRGQGATTQVNQVPRDRTAVAGWGRFTLMNQLRDQSRVPTIETVMRYAPSLNGNVETYGWSWAAAMMLDAYPAYRPVLQDAARRGKEGPEFNRRLFQQVGQKNWPVLAARWRVMCHELDYGFDWSRQRLMIDASDPLWDEKQLQVDVAADRGWQSAGVRFAPGTQLQLTPGGRVELADQPKPWISEPPGVTIQYHRGRPLGQLLACLLPNATARGEWLQPLRVVPVTEPTTLKIDQHSWLLLRVNDDPGAMDDNRGAYQVTID